MEDFEILDPGDDEGDVEWLDVEHDEVGESSRILPPSAPPSRVLASLIALALVLAGIGSAAGAAYHRHETDVRTANLLELIDDSVPPLIEGLAQLAFEPMWHAQPSVHVSFPVVNKSPEPIRLLSAVLIEPGLARTARLAPVGSSTLRPGEAGLIGGTVTVDCTTGPVLSPSQGLLGGASPNEAFQIDPPGDGLIVQALTQGGSTHTALLQPDSGRVGLRQRVCEQQGFMVVANGKTAASVNPKNHQITLTTTAQSTADIPVTFVASAEFYADPEADGVFLTNGVYPALPTVGTVQPGRSMTAKFEIPVYHCPNAAQARQPGGLPPSTIDVVIGVDFVVKGQPVGMWSDTVPFDQVLGPACGWAPAGNLPTY